jgi:hypothetical protein
VERHEVSFAKQIQQLHVAQAVLAGEGLIAVHIVGQDAAAEASQPSHQATSDQAETDDANRTAVEVTPDRPIPAAAGDLGVPAEQLPRER